MGSGTDPLLTAEAVAEILGMRPDFVYGLARRDEIPHLRFGRTLRFRADALDLWLAESERGSGHRSENSDDRLPASR